MKLANFVLIGFNIPLAIVLEEEELNRVIREWTKVDDYGNHEQLCRVKGTNNSNLDFNYANLLAISSGDYVTDGVATGTVN